MSVSVKVVEKLLRRYLGVLKRSRIERERLEVIGIDEVSEVLALERTIWELAERWRNGLERM